MGLGTVTNVAQGARATNAPQSTDRGPTAARRSNRIPDDDDAAVAVIQNLHRAENSGVGKGAVSGRPAATLRQRIQQYTESLRENLAEQSELSGEIADGRFSSEALREVIESGDGTPGRDFWAGLPQRDSALALSSSERSDSPNTGARDARALAWLRDSAQSALLSQQNIEPGRVLLLLREMISSK